MNSKPDMNSFIASEHSLKTSSAQVAMRGGMITGLLLFFLLIASTGCSDSPVDGNPNPEPIPAPEVDAPAAPSALTADSRNAQVALNWDAVEGAEAYFVYRGTSPLDALPDSPLSDRVSGTSFTDNGVSNGTTYYYRVTAVAGASAESAPSEEAAVTPFAAPPGTPGD